jgi:hypothetical protein
MKTQLGKIMNLEQEYFTLYEEKYCKKEINKEDKCYKKEQRETLNLNEGDWVYSDYFEEANKIKKITNGFVKFWFAESNGLDAGILNYIENRTNGNSDTSHRYATIKEIETKLLKEIEKIKR